MSHFIEMVINKRLHTMKEGMYPQNIKESLVSRQSFQIKEESKSRGGGKKKLS